MNWLGGRDSNPDKQIQNLRSYRWTTSQQKDAAVFTSIRGCRAIRLQQPKVDCHERTNRDRLPVLHRRTELPLLYGFDGLLIEP